MKLQFYCYCIVEIPSTFLTPVKLVNAILKGEAELICHKKARITHKAAFIHMKPPMNPDQPLQTYDADSMSVRKSPTKKLMSLSFSQMIMVRVIPQRVLPK